MLLTAAFDRVDRTGTLAGARTRARRARTRAPTIGLLLVLAGVARAQDPPAPPAEHRVSVRTSYDEQRDEGGRDGNPFLDEDLVVIEPVILIETPVAEDARLSILLSHDYVSSASIARLDNYAQQSGASADYYFGADVGVDARVSDAVSVGATVHGAFERDYRSAGLHGRVSVEPWTATRLSLSVGGYHDVVTRIRFDGRNEGTADRETLSLDLTCYRALTPWLHGEVGLSTGWQHGFLETNINAVVLEDRFAPPNPLLVRSARGVEVTEELPDERARVGLHGRARARVREGTAVELIARCYEDSWGVTSWSLEPRLHQWLVPQVLLARVGYRYLRQRAADDYERHLVGRVAPYHRTQDPDLGGFEAHAVGLKLAWTVNATLSIDVGGDLVWRSDGLDQRWASAAVHVSW